VIGKIGEDPGTKWGTEPNTTVEHTLVRKSNVISGDTDGSDAFDPATEWDAYAQNTFDYLGSHSVTVCGLGIVPGDLIVGKSGPSAAPAGDQIIYQITLENTAAATATNVIFTDTLPIGTTYVSDDSGVTPGKPSSQTYVWDLVEIGPTTVVTIHLTVDADARLAPGSMLTNWITATTSLDDDDPDTNSASWQTTISELVSIHDIQFVTDPGSDDASPYEGQTVFVEGIVTAEPGEIDTGTKTFVIEAPGGGPWSGLTVFCNGGFSGLSAPEGTEVRVLGKVSEYYGMTELTVSGGAADVTVLSTGNPLPSPDVLDTSDFDDVGAAISEQWESVLVQFQDATVTELLNYEEWHFDDGTGAARADDLGEIDGDLTYQPEVGDEYDTIRGIGWYSYDNYKLMPRYDSDIGFAYPSIYKDAPTLVAPGELFTYTIRVKNNFTYTLTDVVVSDTIPANAEFAYALDGGLETGGVVSWTVSNLGAFSSVQVRFAVTATSQVTDIVNSDYAVVAGNFTTSVQGDPVLTVVAHEMRIHDIQRSQHLSPFEDRLVWAVQGIVTAVGDKRFFMQDPTPDADEATSEGIQVYVDAAPGVSVGDLVSVTGTVEEYYPGGIGTGNLSTTQLGNPTVAVLSSGNSLPAATVIGIGGRLPPTTVIDGDATGNVDERQPLDPVKNGIDFYESLEAMLVQVNDAHVVGGTNNYGEIAVVSDGAANAGEMTARGGIVIQADDFNPERVIIDDALYGAEPKVDVGDQFSGPVVGVLDYDFGNFKLLNTAALPPTTGFLAMEITSLTRQADQISIATFNVENLYPGDTARFPLLAQRIVLNLGAPDIIGLQEIQDNNGETDNGTTDASQTYQALIDAIKLIGGPTYEYREIAPLDNQDGGAPGANIRVGFLFRADRGLSFIDRSGGDAVTATAAVIGASGVELTYSPGRIDPTNLAFFDSRKPLAGEFLFNDQKLFVVVNHLNSKGGDTPLFGRLQPPVLSSEAQRIQQAQVINDFVDSILALDPGAKVVVLGDLNDFQFSPPLDALKGAVLADLIENLPIAEQYTYIYDGNSQVLDHILVSDKLALDGALVDIVHVNAEFNAAFRVSDHDPVLALLRILPYRILFPLVFR
ncbi:MAG: DUF11 domain-containing protein, partial [Anaerolineales bacterium]|nr:DUF11 domain-containing protein [Anaerolineales bacterium]